MTSTSAHTPPREGSVAVGGVPWLGRMTDKAYLDATIDLEATFDLVYPCPMDQRLLAQLGLDSKAFQAIAMEHHANDDALVQALKSAGASL